MEHVGMYPIDTVKTRMQALRISSSGSIVASSRMRDVLQEIVGHQGVRGFMSGASAIAAGTVPAHVALFGSYELSKRALLEGRGNDPLRAGICGAVSTLSHDALMTPSDVIKQRMQLGCHRSVSDCIQSVVRREGLRALFRSMPTTLTMNLPFGSILVASNETIKDALKLDEVNDPGKVLPMYFAAAGVSGALAAASTQPFDVIKTRLQTQDCLAPRSHLSSLSRAPAYAGFCHALGRVVREEGFCALYRGLLPRMLHAMPAAGVCWGTYESVKSWLRC
jgi:solute carrier family 25 iron transporter 28/37